MHHGVKQDLLPSNFVIMGIIFHINLVYAYIVQQIDTLVYGLEVKKQQATGECRGAFVSLLMLLPN